MSDELSGTTVRRLGEHALVLDAPPPASLDRARRLWNTARAAREWPGVESAVTGLNNLTVFISRSADAVRIEERMRAAFVVAVEVQSEESRLLEIPVRYGGAEGPDLHEVAERCALSVHDVIGRHAAREYIVYAIGFQPGFPYLGGLDAGLYLPRRDQPRLAVAAGSVAIAAEYSAVYPLRAPGGWHIIGRTDMLLFQAERTPAALCAPGNRVRFVPLTGA